MKPQVLFVEDDSSIRSSFAEILTREGASVTTCTSAVEACQRLASDAYDLVITDMRMETPTAGWNVVRVAATLARPPKMVIMTAFPIPKAQLRSYHVEAVLSKGMPTLSLLSKIRELIQRIAMHERHLPPKDGGHDRAV